jgi:hypothetical protein
MKVPVKAIKKFALVAAEWVNLPCLCRYCVTQSGLRRALVCECAKPSRFFATINEI